MDAPGVPPNVPVAPSGWEEIRARAKLYTAPLPRYYLFGIVIAGGTFGVWFPLIVAFATGARADTASIPKNLATYAAPLLATAGVDLLIGEQSSRAYRVLCFIFAAIAVLASVLALITTVSLLLVWLFAGLAALIAIALWALNNRDNSRLVEQLPPPDAATGGDHPVTGSLEGFVTSDETLEAEPLPAEAPGAPPDE